MADAEEEALEGMLDLLQLDLDNARDALALQTMSRAEAAGIYEQALQNLRFLKKEAPVVSINEYLVALRYFRRWKDQFAEAHDQLTVAVANVKKLQSDLKSTQEALQIERKKVPSSQPNTAKILEFSNAHRGRDSSSSSIGA